MCGNFALACPLQQRAVIDAQILGCLRCGQPLCVHVETPFPDALPKTPLRCLRLRYVPMTAQNSH
jgi:hypothetical protein